jgi:hypothetical protein
MPSAPTAAAPVVLNVTRLRFRNPWDMLGALRRFRRLYAGTHPGDGLIRGELSLGVPWTIVNVSIWTNRRAMLLWSGTDAHVAVVRWTYGRVAEVWSADWYLRHQSPSALTWNGNVPLPVKKDEAIFT